MVMDSLDDCSPLERFINVHTGHETQNGGEDMKLFTKIFGSTRKQVAGDSNVVSVLLQSISVGADPKIQVGKIRAIVGDSDETFNGFLSELEMAGDEKPEVVAKAVDIVDNYYKEHLAGDEKPEPEEKKPEEEKKPVAGDSIDYEKLASMVAEKLQPKPEEKVAGDEDGSMPMAGDTSIEAKDSTAFIADIFGGNE